MSMKFSLSLVFIFITQCTGVYMTMNGSTEYKLRQMLWGTYDKTVRPVINSNEAIEVFFSLKLSKLVDVNLKHQIMKTDVWIIQEWTNPFLRWNESEFDGIHTIHVTTNDVWVPDIVLYNNGDEDEFLAGHTQKFKTNLFVESSGRTVWMSPATFKSSCDISVTFFPFDSQVCDLTFGSWTYDNRLLSINQKDTTHETAEKYVESGDWTIKEVNISRQVRKYSCCEHPFSDVTFVFILSRKPLYHLVYLVIPCLLISSLILVNFLITPDSGERIGLCMTILLAMSVYHLILSEYLPETSEGIPLLGIYFMVTMASTTGALIATAIVLNCRNASGHPPKWLLRISKVKLTIRPRRTVVNVISKNGLERKSDHVASAASAPNKVIEGEREIRDREVEGDKNGSSEWQEIARKLDTVFFWIFFIVFLVSTLAVFLSAPHVLDAEHWKNLPR